MQTVVLNTQSYYKITNTYMLQALLTHLQLLNEDGSIRPET